MSHESKNGKEAGRRRSSLEERLMHAFSDFEGSQAHDVFSALLEHKVDLLVEDCAMLAGNEYRTSDAREAVFLLRYLFESPRHTGVDVAIRTVKGPGSFINQGPFEDNLIKLSSRAVGNGKGVRMLFVLDDWVQALADEDSSRVLKDLLLHNVEVALAPREESKEFPVGALAVFHDLENPLCICRFLSGLDRAESRPLVVSHEAPEASNYLNWLRSVWVSASVRRAKAL